jgi:hypothetical protein
MDEFYKRIYEGCRVVLAKHNRSLCEALELKNRILSIDDYSEDDATTIDAGHVWIGAGAPLAEHFNSDFHVALWWDYKSSPAGVVKAAVGIEAHERFRDIRDVYEAEAPDRIRAVADWSSILLCEEVPRDNAQAWRASLDRLVMEWATLWRRLGGLSGIRTRLKKN